ncbi:MAG: endoplasmic oxidoreductin-1 [Alyxoria varia]|nr:MAG: endoplasmic oxidoreductin-1 [Alyxoria varia]
MAFYLAIFTLVVGSPDNQASHEERTSQQPESCAIEPHAIVSDACASFSTLDQLNVRLQPSVELLTHTSDFFSYYRLNLYNKKCPFWSDENSMCGNIACAVNTIDNEEDVPPIWRTEELGKLEGPKAHHPNKRLQREREARPLMGELGDQVGESCVVEYDDECDERDYCVPEDERATAKGDYVSLVENPERFTGYSGPSANQVWEAIYRENCFSKASSSSSQPDSTPFAGFGGTQGQAAHDLRNVMVAPQSWTGNLEDTLELDDECLEKRVFYRIISGMHASISTHLCWDYLNKTTGQWGPNPACYEQRLQSHPERIANLYFNYALVLRAVAKARKSFERYVFCSGDPEQDQLTKKQVLGLADQIASGPTIYDESLMFQDPDLSDLKSDFRNRFRNVSRTMDCVGCDKCRLWGKLQTAGYGTALKILFEFDEQSERSSQLLRRTELVALMNTLDKLSHSLSAVRRFESGKYKIGHGLPTQEWAETDDDLLESDDDSKAKKAPDIMKEFWKELDLVWRTFKWVLRKWWNMPRHLGRIVILELGRVYEYWMGLKDHGRSWKIHRPTVEEL